MNFALFWFKKEFRRTQTWLLGLLMSLGITGLVFVDLFAQRISNTAEQDTRNFMAADFVVRSWSPFDEDFFKGIDSLVKSEDRHYQQSLLASALKPNGEVLNIDLQATDDSYPFYGDWILKNTQLRIDDLKGKNELFADEALIALGFKIGDSLQIGSQNFIVRDFVVKNPQTLNFFSSGSFKIWIHRSQLESTGLTSFGHRIRHTLYLRQPNADAKTFRESFRKAIANPSWRLTSAQQGNSQVQRTVQLLKTYLGLIALCGTFLGLAGLFMIFVSDLKRRLPQLLTLRCLGIKDRPITITLLLPSLVSVFVASFVGFGVATFLESKLSLVLSQNLDIVLSDKTSPLRSLALAIFSGLLSAIPALYFPIQKILQVPTQRIYSSAGNAWILSQFLDRRSILSLASVAFVLSLVLSSNFVLSLANLAVIVVLVALLYGASTLLLKLLPQLPIWNDFLGLFLKRDFSRQRERSLLWVLSLGFSFFFLLLGAFLTHSIQSQLSITTTEGQPNLLIMGASDQDTESLSKILPPDAEELPYVQVRISQINGSSVRERLIESEANLDEEGRSDFRLREYFVNVRSDSNLLIGETLSQSASVFGERLDQNQVRVSLEKDFASRMEIKLGDTLQLDLAGVFLNAKVTSLRTVDWFQFRPNFFMIIPKQDIEGAPLNSLYILKLADKDLSAWQQKIISQLPHLNALDLRQSRDQIQKVIAKLVLAVQGTSAFLLVAALLVLLAIFISRRQELKNEFALLRCLGERSRRLRVYLIRESIVSTTLSWSMACLLALVTSWSLSVFLLKTQFFPPAFSFLALSYGLCLCLVLCLNLALSERTLRAKPQILFSEDT